MDGPHDAADCGVNVAACPTLRDVVADERPIVLGASVARHADRLDEPFVIFDDLGSFSLAWGAEVALATVQAMRHLSVSGAIAARIVTTAKCLA
jgi:hypothetical protein